MSRGCLGQEVLPGQLRWLISSHGLVLLPHAASLPPWVMLICGGLLAWRYRITLRGDPMPGFLVRLLLVVLFLTLLLSEYGRIFGREPGIALLALMLSTKLLEVKRARDALLVIFLDFFLVATAFLDAQEPWMALYLFGTLIMLLATWIALVRLAPLPWRSRLRLSGTLLLQAAPLAILLFLLFPRVPGPLWNLPSDARGGGSGLSDEMRPGSIGELILSEEVAFRVRFANDIPPPEDRYWRGPVLERIDPGGVWRANEPLPRYARLMAPAGARIDYTVTLEPHGERWIFALELPDAAPPRASLTQDHQLLATEPVVERQVWELTSYTRHVATNGLHPFERRANLQLPAGENPRTLALGREWAKRFRSPEAVVEEALEMFRRQPFWYTLRPPRMEGDAIDRFLFDNRRGFCEHYAGAFVLLMRAAGIPARVVTGYQGGEHNPVSDYWIVRQSDAHAWAEVWLPTRGWRRIDPTAAISPARVDRGLEGAERPRRARASGTVPDLLHRAALFWDAANDGWNRWFLAYGTETQDTLLRALHLPAGDWLMLGAVLAGGSVAILTLLYLVLVGRPATRLDPARRAWDRACRQLARAGIPRHPWEPPGDYGRRVARQRPELATEILHIADLYSRLRYGREAKGETLLELRRAVVRLASRRRG
ncbi:MAG TPA: DUF3488 domain-containing protein [Thiotrichales bacterium]|nr:DUF3488 domain-containing protein [Thiotrichales bacterium]